MCCSSTPLSTTHECVLLMPFFIMLQLADNQNKTHANPSINSVVVLFLFHSFGSWFRRVLWLLSGIHQVDQCIKGVGKDHPGPCPAHNLLHLLSFTWRVAMNRAILAGWFLLTKNTVMKPFLRVILQFQATAADTGYRGMLFRQYILIMVFTMRNSRWLCERKRIILDLDWQPWRKKDKEFVAFTAP